MVIKSFIILGGFMRYLLCVGSIKKGKFTVKINKEVKKNYGK